MLQRGLLLAAMLLASLSLGGKAYSAEPSMNDVMARLKALEDKNKDLEGKLKTAQTAAERRVSVDAQVDKALRSSDATMASVVTATDPNCRPLKIGGYIDFSYQYNINRPDNFKNNLRVFDSGDANSFNLHLAEINFERLPTCPGEAGFRIDLDYGTDTRFFQHQDAFGFRSSSFPPGTLANTIPADFETFALQQAYISYIAPIGNGITLDAGKFVTWSGAEVIEAYDNMNATRSFLFGYAIPFHHTGVRATYDVFQGGDCGGKWTVGLGLVNGWDNVQDQNNAKTLIWMSNWQPTSWFNWVLTGTVGDESFVDERARLAAALAGPTLLDDLGGDFAGSDLDDSTIPGITAPVSGKFFDGSDGSPRVLFDTTMTFTPWDDLTFQINADWAREGNGDSWYGAAAYAKWQFHENWYLAVRGEYFSDDEGVRTGRAQDLWSGTVTVDWKLAEPLHVRFEYRHDDSNVDAFSDSRGVNDAFFFPQNPFNADSQDTVMMQWLYKF